MNQTRHVCSEQALTSHFAQSAPQLMWFLGAGTSRTARMPTATDIIWDLKRKYYCLQENQNLQLHDLNNESIRKKIQGYLDCKKFPPLWSPEEYSFYFDLTFGQDYEKQQQYINAQLSSHNISLNVGHRAFAALLGMGALKVAFTTNFDEVVETAYSAVTGKHLTCFHLEGSYAALDALNAERFPIYAKIHGDFRYRSIKNLAADLLQNDKEIQKCFLAAATRYGIIVSGYSGRDANVISMFRAALEQNNSFPHGLFWTTTKLSNAAESVIELIEFARNKSVKAYLVETGTFDIMLSKMWRHLPDKPQALDLKVRAAKAKPVCIALPSPGNQFPILRTNALPITECPKQCATIDYGAALTFRELRDKVFEQKPDAVVCYTDRLLFWGSSKDVSGLLNQANIKGIKNYDFEEQGATIAGSTILRSFVENALAQGLCAGKPLKLRRRGKTCVAVVDHDLRNDRRLEPMKSTLGYQGTLADLTGAVPGLDQTFWAEAVSIKVEHRNNALWCLLEPDIWIAPLMLREKAVDFLRAKQLRRYNTQSYRLLSDWIQLLLGTIGDQEVEVSCFPATDYPTSVKISARTGFSYRRG